MDLKFRMWLSRIKGFIVRNQNLVWPTSRLRAFDAVKTSVDAVSFWGTFPLSWSETKNHVSLTQKWRILLWYINILIQGSNVGYLLVRALQLNVSGNKNPIITSFVEYMLLGLAIPLVCIQCCFFRHPESLVYLVNTTIVSHGNDGNKIEVGKGCERFLWTFMNVWKPILMSFLLLMAAYPENPGHFTSLLPNLSYLQLAPMLVLYAYIVRTWWCNIHLLLISLLVHVFAEVSALKRMTRFAEQVDTLILALKYRSLQLLQTKTNAVYAWPLALMKALWVLTTLRNLYAAFKVDGIFRLQQTGSAMFMLIYLSIMLRAMAHVHGESCRVLRATMIRRRDPWFRRFHRSCGELKVEVGSVYFIDYQVTLTLYAFLVQNTLNLLLSES